ncbi:MAG: Phage SPO1 DNA polymerase protein [uncultured bacterium]|nr:MAG: Phage SPO1 DNA polymerase protein [uncultured bacterium]OGT08758.1 MAG: uracil-DNA glycosylase [Gammaproteobacteria bacterium RBG_16_37_9]
MTHKKEYLKEMGIDIWQDKSRINDASMTAKTSSQNNLEDIKKQVIACKLCDLHKTRTNTVFGIGNEKAKVMFIGEAPGANEDLKGEPFVGRAGMLLNSMLRSIGLERTDVYIANILKCRPPNNRDPLPQEVKLCTPYLQQQIALIQPKVLIAVGRIAAQFLLNTMESMSKLRGNTYQYGEQKIPLLVTYHPAYLLRSPSEKRKAYVDFLLIKKMVE